MSGAGTRQMDRARFVKLAGVGAGAAVTGSLMKAGAARAATRIPLRVAVMMPSGSRYPTMGRSLVDGLALGFAGSRTVDATTVTADVLGGYRGARTIAEGLLDDHADVVVAGISALAAQRLAPVFQERGKALIVANVGAHVVLPSARNAFVLHNSLMYWQASFMAGRYAAQAVGSKGFLATSLFDAGYDTVYAFRRGFESAGGTIVGEGVTHVDPAKPGLTELVAAVRASGANFVFGLYSGPQAAEFLGASAGTGVKVLAGGLAVEDYVLSTAGTAAVGTISLSSWTAARSTKENLAFTKDFKARYARTPDPFAALGYDTAALIAEGTQRAVASRVGLGRLVEALGGATIDGPRGHMTVDAATNMVTGPIAIRAVNRTTRGIENVDVGWAPPIASFPDVLAPLATDPRSGYLNEYVCA
jgi:ABC-type branched-subunit amino acid transport system substrate-binding protein